MVHTTLLFITGTQAEKKLKNLDWNKISDTYKIKFEVLNIPIAAFIPPEQVQKSLEKWDPNEIDFVILPGLVPWDGNRIRGDFSDKVVKGPQFLINLIEVLEKIKPTSFSPTEPADKVYQRDTEIEMKGVIRKKKQDILADPKEQGNYLVISEEHPELICHPELPAVLLGEIVDAPLKKKEKIFEKIEYLRRSGADIIDLGAVAGEEHGKFFKKIIPQIHQKYGLPVSIDSLNPNEIIAAYQGGVDMILSICEFNYKRIINHPSVRKEVPIVLIPFSGKSSIDQEKINSPEYRLAQLMKLGNIMVKNGFEKLFLDPITNSPISPGLVPSIEALSLLNRSISKIPQNSEGGEIYKRPQLFMGIGNVSELTDGESPGINTLLAMIAAECNVTGILTTEYSNKCRRNLKEVKKSLNLAFLAKNYQAPPINLGVDALFLKSKNSYPKRLEDSQKILDIDAEDEPAIMDPKGYFKIFIEKKDELIELSYYENETKSDMANITIRGKDAVLIYKKVIEMGLVSRLDHAAYLGKELKKAELAVKYGIGYKQS